MQNCIHYSGHVLKEIPVRAHEVEMLTVPVGYVIRQHVNYGSDRPQETPKTACASHRAMKDFRSVEKHPK